MIHPRDTTKAQSAQPWAAPDITQSCATCMSFANRTCTDPQSIFHNESRHPASCCPLWARGCE